MQANEYLPLSWYLLRTLRARVASGTIPRTLLLENCSRVETSWIEELKTAVPEEIREWDLNAWLERARAV